MVLRARFGRGPCGPSPERRRDVVYFAIMTNETMDGPAPDEPDGNEPGPELEPGKTPGREPGLVDALIVYLLAVLFVAGAGFFLRLAANRWLNLLFPAGIGAIPLVFARFRRIAPSRAFPFSVPAPRQALGAFLMSIGTLCGFVLVSYILSVFFPGLGGMSGSSPERLLSGGLLYNLFFVGILPAVSEELLCRGLILSGLKRSLSRRRAIALCALMFALLHMEPLAVPFTFAAGLVIAWVAVETSSIILPILMHLLHNVSLYFVIAATGFTLESVPDERAIIAALVFTGAASAVLFAAGGCLVRCARP